MSGCWVLACASAGVLRVLPACPRFSPAPALLSPYSHPSPPRLWFLHAVSPQLTCYVPVLYLAGACPALLEGQLSVLFYLQFLTLSTRYSINSY